MTFAVGHCRLHISGADTLLPVQVKSETILYSDGGGSPTRGVVLCPIEMYDHVEGQLESVDGDGGGSPGSP